MASNDASAAERLVRLEGKRGNVQIGEGRAASAIIECHERQAGSFDGFRLPEIRVETIVDPEAYARSLDRGRSPVFDLIKIGNFERRCTPLKQLQRGCMVVDKDHKGQLSRAQLLREMEHPEQMPHAACVGAL
ncbi:hypothetical protein MTR72_39125 [Bradyrhizobium sp. ISRA442]|uniref:hypothetical protein n=1 Tax=Bradyrhizobium sp. ISRA442 TaxID=2866197 RepID=UPI00311AD983